MEGLRNKRNSSFGFDRRLLDLLYHASSEPPHAWVWGGSQGIDQRVPIGEQGQCPSGVGNP